jgi:hypothetical protein
LLILEGSSDSLNDIEIIDQNEEVDEMSSSHVEISISSLHLAIITEEPATILDSEPISVGEN